MSWAKSLVKLSTYEVEVLQKQVLQNLVNLFSINSGSNQL